MGGSLAITIRQSNGKEYRMLRWTNSLPNFITNPKFFKEDKQWFKDYMEPWFDMKKDYEQNKTTGKFKLNMTDCYFPYSYLAPADYGLVVIDFKTKTLLTMQGYSDLNSIMLHKKGGFIDKWTQKNYNELKNAGLIKGYSIYDRLKKNFKLLKTPNLSEKNPFVFAMIHFKNAGWTYKRFEDTQNGKNAFKKKIMLLGFKLSKTEEKMWKGYEV